MSTGPRRRNLLVLLFLVVLVGCRGGNPQPGQEATHQLHGDFPAILTDRAGELPFPGTPFGKWQGSILFLSISSDWVPSAVYRFDADSNKAEIVVEASPDKVIYDTAHTGDWLVWVESSNDMVRADWRLMALNLKTGERLEIDRGKVSPEGVTKFVTLFGPYLSASEGQVVWSTFEPGSGNGAVAVVRRYDLSTRESEVIDRITDVYTSNFGHPRIHGDVVVYDQGRIDETNRGRHGAIVLYNLRTRERKILDEGLNYTSPDIFGNHVVWMAGRNSIRYYHLETQERKYIVQGGRGKWHPRVHASLVVWQQSKDTVDIVPLMGEKQFTPVTLTQGVDGGSLSGPFLYWRERGRTTEGTTTKYVDLSMQP